MQQQQQQLVSQPAVLASNSLLLHSPASNGHTRTTRCIQLLPAPVDEGPRASYSRPFNRQQLRSSYACLLNLNAC
jgi:hypothetical protein